MSEDTCFIPGRNPICFLILIGWREGNCCFVCKEEYQLYINQQKYALAAGSVILVFP